MNVWVKGKNPVAGILSDFRVYPYTRYQLAMIDAVHKTEFEVV